MLKRAALVVVLAALVVAGCGAADDEPSREPPSGHRDGASVRLGVERQPSGRAPDARGLADGLNRFAFDFYGVLAERSRDENLVFSPLSIGVAFGMADAGARGETAAEIEDVFHLPGSGRGLHAAFSALDQALARERKDTVVRLANRMYPAAGFDVVPAFTRTLDSFYRAPVERLDFAGDPEGSRERINAWVADRTEERIRELLGSGTITPETVLVLVNALYLEAKWSQPFGESPTEERPFTRPDGSRVDVPLMRNPELRSRYAQADAYQAVEVPYGDGALSMLVVVPPKGKLDELERGFDADRLAEIDAGMRKGVVDLALPRWSTSFDVDLVEPLRELGLTLPFDGGDFTGISAENPFIDAAVHAADIEVDEEGTVAAAATAVAFAVCACPRRADAVVRVDRPFLYLIRDRKTGTVLFVGRVTDPST